MTKEGVVALIKKRIEKEGSAQKYALSVPVSPQYLNDVLKGRRELGPSLLNSLGLKAVVSYVAATSSEAA